MKYLHFTTNYGDSFVVNEQGHIARFHAFIPQPFCRNWLFIGVSKHHWRRGIDHNLAAIFDNPDIAKGGLIWDMDHESTRQWNGSPLPRIKYIHVSNSQTR